MNVTLYAICKNEEKNVEKFIKNSKRFSHTVVVDTGSTDNTVQLLRDAGITVYEHAQTRKKFDFAKARNQALSYVETDWAFSLDFSEDIEGVFLEGLENFSEELTMFQHQRYDKENEDSEPVLSNTAHTRFHRVKNYTWDYAVHEQPRFVATEDHPKESKVDTTFKIIKTTNDSVDKQLFYLSIAEREFKKNPKSTYYLWYIFLYYYRVKNFEQALEFGQEYLTISKAYFDPVRIDVFLMCSEILMKPETTQMAANYAFHAVSESMNLSMLKDIPIPSVNYLGRSFQQLMNIGITLNNPDIIVFASAFAGETKRLPERTNAIDKLFLTNLDDIPSTSWNGHEFFAEYLVRYLKPNTIVDLGVDYGYSTFAFAMPRIGHVYGIDNFVGDEYVGYDQEDMKYQYVNMKREKLHLQDYITFIRGDFSEVASTWDKTIDILHIDGSHVYEDVKRDYETWSKFVSDDGVILFHDTCIEEANGHEYGVKKFFEELDLPKFTFTHSFGLGVASKNQTLIDEFKKQFNIE